MNLGNLVRVVVHHPLIEEMTYLGCQDEFPIVSTLVHVMHIG